MRARAPKDKRQLVELLFGTYRRRILSLLLLRLDIEIEKLQVFVGKEAGNEHA